MHSHGGNDALHSEASFIASSGCLWEINVGFYEHIVSATSGCGM